MECYQGVKIDCRCLGSRFDGCDASLTLLNHWTYLLSQLGLTPIHPEGAYGNQSCRTGADSFVITRSGMTPRESERREDYCHVVACDAEGNNCDYFGHSLPSSETLLHHLLYHNHPWIGAILHGHSPLLLLHADHLDIPTTASCHPYGTRELAISAIEMVSPQTRFFILKDHGFVAIGSDLNDAGRTVLTVYSRLLSQLLAS
jgi:ribulose-5-phosphate 4-epimerase/fuculose-1-phosphate aldolase